MMLGGSQVREMLEDVMCVTDTFCGESSGAVTTHTHTQGRGSGGEGQASQGPDGGKAPEKPGVRSILFSK